MALYCVCFPGEMCLKSKVGCQKCFTVLRNPDAKVRDVPCPHSSSFEIDGFDGPSHCSGFSWFISVAQGEEGAIRVVYYFGFLELPKSF